MNEKKISKKLIAILCTLIAVAIIIIAFVGIYVPKLNKLKNIIPEATYSSEINGAIEYRLSVDNTEEEKEVYIDENGNIKGEVSSGHSTSSEDWENTTGFATETRTIRTNPTEKLNKDNFEKTKEIIEKRLDSLGATDYSIRLNDEDGYMVIELSENDDIDYLYQTAVGMVGKIEVIDYQTGVVLIDSSHIKSASEFVNSTDGINYSVYLNLEFDEEGAKILNEISKEYISYTNDEGEQTIDYIAILMDGSPIYTTYFGEEYTANTISVPMGQNITDEDTLNAYTESAKAVSTIINLGQLPITYSNDNTGYLIRSNIDSEALLIVKIILIVVLVLITIVFAIKYGLKGFLAGIFNFALIGSLILILKLLSIVISISSMISIALLIFINVIFLIKYLNNLKNDIDMPFVKALKSYYGTIFPVIVVAFIYTMFSVNSSITGIGMTLFWGLLIQILLNTVITRNVIK